MYQLYYAPGTCSMAIHVILNELGQKVELKKIDLSKPRTPEHLAVNPRGAVPVLVDDGHVIREGGAIITYLVDKHESSLMPRSGFARATALEWLMFANSTLHPAYSKAFGLLRSPVDKEATEILLTAAIANINKLWAEVDGVLAKQPYICGKECTAADILIAVIANWSGNFQGIVLGENTKRMLREVTKRPSYQKALADEGVEYKAAA